MPKPNKYCEQVQFIRQDVAFDNNKSNTDFVSALDKIEKDRSIDGLNRNERKSVAFTFDDIPAIVKNFHLKHAILVPRSTHCHLCGTSIHHNFVIVNDITKRRLHLGSECIIKHEIRIPGYNTVEEIINFVENEKRRMSLEHAVILWKQSPEYKKNDVMKSVATALVEVKDIYIQSHWKETVPPLSDTYYGRILNGEYGKISDPHTFRQIDNSSKLVQDLCNEINGLNYRNTYGVRVPKGRSASETIDVEIANNHITKESVVRIQNHKKSFKNFYIRGLIIKINDMLRVDKDTITAIKIPTFRIHSRFALINESVINKFIEDQKNLTEKVKAIAEKHIAIINKAIEDHKNKNENVVEKIVEAINAEKIATSVKGIILGEYNGILHRIGRTTDHAVEIIEKKNGEIPRTIWLPRSQIKLMEKEIGKWIYVPGWLAESKRIEGAV